LMSFAARFGKYARDVVLSATEPFTVQAGRRAVGLGAVFGGYYGAEDWLQEQKSGKVRGSRPVSRAIHGGFIGLIVFSCNGTMSVPMAAGVVGTLYGADWAWYKYGADVRRKIKESL